MGKSSKSSASAGRTASAKAVADMASQSVQGPQSPALRRGTGERDCTQTPRTGVLECPVQGVWTAIESSVRLHILPCCEHLLSAQLCAWHSALRGKGDEVVPSRCSGTGGDNQSRPASIPWRLGTVTIGGGEEGLPVHRPGPRQLLPVVSAA